MIRLTDPTRDRGFTLVELLVTLVVLGLLAGVAVTSFSDTRTRARDEVAVTQVRQLVVAAEAYRMLRDDTDAYDPADPLLTTTYYDAAETLTASRRPDVVAQSSSPSEISFGLSGNRVLLGASVMSESGMCVHAVGWPGMSAPVVTVGPDMYVCSAFAEHWDAEIEPDVLAALLAMDGTDTLAWASTDSEPHRAPDGSIINRAPFATDDLATTAEDTPVTIDVLANDYDVDGDLLSVGEHTAPAHGTVAPNGAGRLVYTPAADFNGTDTFSYAVSDGRGSSFIALVTVEVTPVNDAPVAGDDHATTAEDTPVAIDVLEDDVDVDGDPLTVTVESAPAHGTASVQPDGTVLYTPASGFSGDDSFTYRASDGTASDTALVTVQVTDVNDAPVATDDAPTTAEDTPVTIDVLANDSDVDGDTLAVAAVDQPRSGTAVLDASGAVTYYPAADFSGTDRFTYDVTDGRGGTDTAAVAIIVTPVNDAPVARDDTAQVPQDQPVTVVVRDNDNDVDGDVLAVTVVGTPTSGQVVIDDDGDVVTFTPALGHTGSASFTYTVADPDGATSTARVDVTVLPADDTVTICNRPGTADEQTLVVASARGEQLVADGEADYGRCGHQDHAPEGGGATLVTICHKPGTPAEQTMQVDDDATRSHYRHGDYAGACTGGG